METAPAEVLEPCENGEQPTANSKLQAPSSIAHHRFCTKIMETPIFFEVIKLGNGLYVWIGNSEGTMNDLAFSIPTTYDQGKPRATKVINLSGDTQSECLSSRLSKKLKKPVYVSFNLVLGVSSEKFVQDVQLRLFEEISIFPEKF